MKNILYATTRNFNPGDEIIYRGVRNLLEGKLGKTNPIYWNRHPNIRPANASQDNSFDSTRNSSEAIDYAAFAGSPGWVGTAAEELYSAILKDESMRIGFFGLGSTGHRLNIGTAGRQVFRGRADVVLCRDIPSRDAVAEILGKGSVEPVALPCPSVFHCKNPRPRTELRVVGLNYQSDRAGIHSVKRGVSELCLEVFRSLSKRYDVRIICNFAEDFHEACSLFDPSIIRFSADSADFEDFFNEIDCMVGPRLHGCLGAIGTGAPAFLIDSYADARRRGAAEMIPVLGRPDGGASQVVREIEALQVRERSEEIFAWIAETRNSYAPYLSQLSPRSRPQAVDGVCHYSDLSEARKLIERDQIARTSAVHREFLRYCQYSPAVMRAKIDRLLRRS